MTVTGSSRIFGHNMSLNLTRMSAAGNVFYLALDLDLSQAEAAELAHRLCAGLDLCPEGGSPPARPADGLIIGYRGESIPRQIMFNPDGSRGLCANGVRCLAWLLEHDEPGTLSEGRIETEQGSITVSFLADEIEACLGQARTLTGFPPPNRPHEIKVGRDTLEGYLVDVGNAQVVLFGGAPMQARCREIGALLQEHPLFPDGINVEFVNPQASGWTVRVWERGAGETLSCGTGAVATAVAGPNGLQPGASRRLHYPGGDLKVHMDDKRRLYLTGPVRMEGQYRYQPEISVRSTDSDEETA